MTFNLNNATKGSIYKFSYPCKENKYVCYPLIGKFPPGIFLLEIYGAEGGKIENNNGGKGGFSKGILSLYHYVDAYLYIGAQGKTTSNELNSSTERTFGGGGSATQSPNVHSYSSSGGGASDIRLFKDDLYHRVIVAGGGGGTGNFNTEYSKGGDGGGSKGGSPSRISQSESTNYAGKGGEQEGSEEYFGQGGNDVGNGCGGGGGWYGGQGGYGYNNPGGGGSGFVYNITNKEIAEKAGLDLPESVFLTLGDTMTSNHYGDGLIQITVIEVKRNKITCITPKRFFQVFVFCIIFYIK